MIMREGMITREGRFACVAGLLGHPFEVSAIL